MWTTRTLCILDYKAGRTGPKDAAPGRSPPQSPPHRPPFWSGAQVEAAGLRRLARRMAPVPVVPARLPRGGAMCGARPAQTCKSLPRRVGGASRSSCRVLCAQVQPVITWGSCLRGRGSLWRDWLITLPGKKASRARRHRRRARATASSERASSTVRRPAHSTSPAAIDPALPPPRRADTRRSVEDGGEGKERMIV